MRALMRSVDGKGRDEIKVRVGKTIRRLREKAGLTLEALATTAGLSRGFLWAVELGQKSASLETLEKLATALEIDIHDFLGPKKGAKVRNAPDAAPAGATPAWLARRLQAISDKAPPDEITRFDRIAHDYFAPYRRRAKR